MREYLAVSAQNTWSPKFELLGDRHFGGLPGRALLSIVQGSVASTVSLRRYDLDGAVIQITTYTAGAVIEVPVTGKYDVGVATGGFGTGAITVVVEQ